MPTEHDEPAASDRGGGDRTIRMPRTVKACNECGHRFGAEAAFCPFDGTKLQTTSWDPSDALVGTVIDGRYHVKGLLGEGGMGSVYEVVHKALGRSFAMKVLRRTVAREQDLAQRFIHEAQATAALKHPNIVSITDFGETGDGTPYFVMELLVGRTLAELLKGDGPFSPERACPILLQMASGLGAAHEAGIIHRDLKPENVFLSLRTSTPPGSGGFASGAASRDDEVKIVDFGAAKVMGSSRITKTGIVFGTPHYMSPEQASGQPVDHRADVYALGVIMYEMLTGRVPFEADTYMGVLTQHMFVRPKPPSALRPERAAELGAVEAIALRALEKKPEDRYQTMHGLAADLEKVLGGGSIEPRQRPSSVSGPASSGPGSRAGGSDARASWSTDPSGRVSAFIPKRRGGWPLAAIGVAALGVAAFAVWSRADHRAATPGSTSRTTAAVTPASASAAVAAKEPAPPVAAPQPPRAGADTATASGPAAAPSSSGASSASPSPAAPSSSVASAPGGAAPPPAPARKPTSAGAAATRGAASDKGGPRTSAAAGELPDPWAK